MQITNLILILVACVLFQACSATKSQSSESLLKEEIGAHGAITISTGEKGKSSKIEVLRSRIDTLEGESIIEVNMFLSSLAPRYPGKVDFIFIGYYPGKDQCNSTGLATRQSVGEKNKQFNNEISKRHNIGSISIYKNSDGLARWDLYRSWSADHERLIERTFFEYHYPCSSYVVLHKSGKYYAYFGESWLEKQISDVDLFMDFADGTASNNG